MEPQDPNLKDSTPEDAVSVMKRRQQEIIQRQEWREKMFIRQKCLELAIQANGYTDPPGDVVKRALMYFNWLNSGDHSA